jgi:aspartate carbamoyltransferase catalytic subunit
VNIFFEDSTRTRTSFEIAGKWLSADTINVSAKGSSVSKGESLRDTMLTLDAMGTDAFVIRHPSSGAAQQVAGWVRAQVINAGDGQHEHPTQALLDAYAMRQHWRRLRQAQPTTDGSVPGPEPDEGELVEGFTGKRIAIVGDLLHSRVVRSNVLLQRVLGGEVVLVAPPTLLPTGVEDWGCEVTGDLDAVLPDADIVMMLRVQRERMAGGFFPTEREYTEGFGLTPERLAALKPTAAICHPGPMNRGVEISSAAADAANSLVLDQVAAGVAVRMSVLYHLLGSDEGALR